MRGRAAWMSTVDVPAPPTSNHAYKPLSGAQGKIIYTETDEAPALATYSLYPAVAKVSINGFVRVSFRSDPRPSPIK